MLRDRQIVLPSIARAADGVILRSHLRVRFDIPKSVPNGSQPASQ